jgi:sugar/nucleoside kinase (ribokinase family)
VPVAGEVGEPWATAVPDTAYLAVGWQGMLRELVAGARVARRPPAPSALLDRADLVGVSHHDVDPRTSLSVLAGFLKPGADLLVTQGGDGGLLVHVGAAGPDAVLRYLPTATDRETDPTGAGDTFAGGLMGYLAACGDVGEKNLRQAIVHGTVRNSLGGAG